MLKHYDDLLKRTLTNYPYSDFDLPFYLTSVQTIYDLQNMPHDLRATLLLPHIFKR